MHEGGRSSTHTHMRFRGNTSTRKTLNIIKCFKQYILELNISGTTWEKEEAGNGRANKATGSGACWVLAGGTTSQWCHSASDCGQGRSSSQA